MKNLRYFLLFLSLFNFKAQKKSIIPVINDKQEKFDINVFSKEVKKNRKDKIYITSGENTFIVNDKTGKSLIYYNKSYNPSTELSAFSGYDYSQNPLFGIFKEFYPNEVLKTKGVFCWFGFKIGKWYYYDEEGKLASTENTDDGWDFTYKMVFDYCKKNNIPLTRKEHGMRTEIRKYFSKEKNTYLWGITYIDNSKKVERTINLDRKDGKMLSTWESPLTYHE